jgi:hypothetical protein
MKTSTRSLAATSTLFDLLLFMNTVNGEVSKYVSLLHIVVKNISKRTCLCSVKDQITGISIITIVRNEKLITIKVLFDARS